MATPRCAHLVVIGCLTLATTAIARDPEAIFNPAIDTAGYLQDGDRGARLS